jgi:hypothetical protein
MIKKSVLFLILPLVFAGFFSCGLEDIYYLAPVRTISMSFTDTATIVLPGSGAEGYNYFDHFVIFYRIYISANSPTGQIVTSDDRSSINTTLNSDWNAIYPSTDITNTNIDPNISALFTNRRYYTLMLEGEEINNILSSGSLGRTLEIHFPPNGQPVLNLNDNEHILYRYYDRTFAPEPNRYFFNSEDLCNNAKAISTINADVATHSDSLARYTYVSMYIAAMGKDKLTSFYSMPAFIGVFRLPEAN